jgi:signal peptidase I
MGLSFAEWRSERAQRRTRTDARELAAEARRLLKKNDRLPTAVVAEVEATATEVEAAVAGGDADRLSAALAALEEKMSKHLAFARKSSTREYLESIVVAVGVAILLRAFVVEAFQIPSGSMIPTLEIGDHIFVSKFSYGFVVPFTNKKVLQYAHPKRGDVVVFKYPRQTEIDYIKRVVAIGGDKIELRQNQIFINDKPVPREMLTDRPCRAEGSGFPCERWAETLDGERHVVLQDIDRGDASAGPFHVPPGSVFVMGDNRDNSNDSRVWGTVPEELIKGRALIIWWSRDPSQPTGLSLDGIRSWFSSIRFERFFHLVD